ncbi:beta-N-acetylhexosaminidase [Maricurvus nonylphenolicus]|uniref:beta-N-acetylhexosaminidase n=1 Tax=Maricurvus nonylphenolicus TaxID=1008307 RepID=UPI0036F2824E
MSLGPLILDLEGTVLTDEERELLLHPMVGGVIIFARNIENYTQLTSLLSAIRECRSELLICVDQEGGRVQRCRDGFTRIPAMQSFHQLHCDDPAKAEQLAEDCGWLLASEVIACGFDFSFAPVLDVDDNHCSVIGDRAFSHEPERVAQLGRAFIRGMQDAGMSVTGKHFPGHGSVVADSHLELPVDTRSWEAIAEHDLVPFQALSKTLDAVMPAHILFDQIDDQPVGFSSRWLKGVLRKQLAFEGVIFSDDLTMEGASVVGSYEERARLALEAGCDSVLVCNNRQGAKAVLHYLDSADIQPSSRLGSMRAKRYIKRAALEATSRWQSTVQQLLEMDSK